MPKHYFDGIQYWVRLDWTAAPLEGPFGSLAEARAAWAALKTQAG